MSNDNNNQEQNDFVDLRGDAPGQTPPHRAPAPHTSDHGGKPRRKRKWPIITLIVIAVLALASMVQITGGRMISGNMAGGTPVYDESFVAASVSSLDIRLSTARINVRRHNNNDVRVVFDANRRDDAARPVYTLDVQGNLRIGLLDSRSDWSISFGIPPFRSSTLTIYLPWGLELENVSLTATTGRINAANIEASGDVQIRTTTGRITAENIVGGNLDISATTGRITIDDATTNSGDAQIRATTGSISAERINSAANLTASATTGRTVLSDIDAAGSFAVSTTTGRIRVDRANAANLRTTATTGRVTLAGLDVQGDVEVRTTTGSVNVDGANARYIQTSSTTGRNTINYINTTGGATVRTTTGRIAVSDSRIDGALSASATTGRISLSNVDTDMNRANLNNNRNARISVN